MEATKMTEVQIFAAIKDLAAENGRTDIVEFAEKKIAQAEAKAAKAKERAAQKKVEGDEFQAQILSVITDEFKSIRTIANEVGSDSDHKVISRLTNLLETGQVIKEKIDGKVHYKLG